MTLVAATIPLCVPTAGDMEWTIATVASLSGLQEIEPGWVLANGVLLPAGTKYDALRAIVGTNYGANGTLPTLLDGVQPIARGASAYPTINGTDGAITVTLAQGHITDHTHTWDYESTTVFLQDGWANNGSTPPYDDDAYPATRVTENAGSGGAHNNMPPYVVVEGMMIKL